MVKAPMITAISFDGDATLWDFDNVMRASLGKVLKELQRCEPALAAELTVDRMIAIRDTTAAELKTTVIDLHEVRHESFRRITALTGKPDMQLADRLNDIYFTHRDKAVSLFDDTRPALDKLGKRYKLGLASNGNTSPDRCGLGSVFAFTLYAVEAGVAKPDRRFFEQLLDRAGCTAEQLLHVGDALEDDIFGAQQLGIRTVWLNRSGAKNMTGIVPEHEIRSLTEIEKIIEFRW